MAKGMILRRGAAAANRLPEFTYIKDGGGTASYTLFDEGDGNWRIRFLESGMFTPGKDIHIDVCVVGGGGGANRRGANAVGACGGFTTNQFGIVAQANTNYPVVIGAGGPRAASTTEGTDGGQSSAFGASANGGERGRYSASRYGGSGGAGSAPNSAPGTDGGNGAGTNAGKGQGTTTREFGEPAGALYSTGGSVRSSPQTKLSNTGDGGDAHHEDQVGSSGASGVVVIRNHRA